MKGKADVTINKKKRIIVKKQGMSMQEELSAVNDAFRDEFRDDSDPVVESSNYFWVVDTYGTFVVVEDGAEYYRVSYSLTKEDGYEFAPISEWVPVEKRYVEVDGEKVEEFKEIVKKGGPGSGHHGHGGLDGVWGGSTPGPDKGGGGGHGDPRQYESVSDKRKRDYEQHMARSVGGGGGGPKKKKKKKKASSKPKSKPKENEYGEGEPAAPGGLPSNEDFEYAQEHGHFPIDPDEQLNEGSGFTDEEWEAYQKFTEEQGEGADITRGELQDYMESSDTHSPEKWIKKNVKFTDLKGGKKRANVSSEVVLDYGGGMEGLRQELDKSGLKEEYLNTEWGSEARDKVLEKLDKTSSKIVGDWYRDLSDKAINMEDVDQTIDPDFTKLHDRRSYLLNEVTESWMKQKHGSDWEPGELTQANRYRRRQRGKQLELKEMDEKDKDKKDKKKRYADNIIASSEGKKDEDEEEEE